MKEGKELDAIVSEKVMGLCAHRETERLIIEDDDIEFRCLACGNDVYGKRCPGYSTDTKPLMEVLNRLRYLGWGYLIRYEGSGHYVEFEHLKSERIVRVVNDDMHVAVCLAALQSVEC